MSKFVKKQQRPSRSITDFFKLTSSPAPASSPASSQTIPRKSASTSTSKNTSGSSQNLSSQNQPAQRFLASKNKASSARDLSPSSSSPTDSPVFLTPNSSARVPSSLTSSPDDDVIVVTDSPMANTKSKPKSKSSDPVPTKKKGFKPLPVATPSVAKTSVRRRNLNPPPTAKASSGPTVLQLAKQRPSLKRKLTHDNEEADDTEAVRALPEPAKSTASQLSELSTLTSSSCELLAPKKNISSSAERPRISGPSTPSKKARLNPRNPTRKPARKVDEVIPSSQSDEEELTMATLQDISPAEIIKSVDKWRRDTSTGAYTQETTKPEPLEQEQALPGADTIDVADSVSVSMDVDGEIEYLDHPVPDAPQMDDDFGLQTVPSEDEVKGQLEPSSQDLSTPMKSPRPSASQGTTANGLSQQQPHNIAEDAAMNDFFCPSTPPPLSIPELSPTKTPVVLDQKSKTEQIIAQIRARAMANAVDSDDEQAPLEFKELEDSSDEDFDEGFLKEDNKGKGKSKNHSSALSRNTSSATSPDTTSREPSSSPVTGRYNLRKHSPPQSANAIAGSSTSKRPHLPVKKPAKKRKTLGPLDTLLKEKSTADKRGGGSDTLRKAEELLAASSPLSSKRDLFEEMEDEEGCESDVDSVGRRARKLMLSPTRAATHRDDSDSEEEEEGENEGLQEDEYRKILGDKGGAAVGNILAKDRALKQEKGKRRKVVRGVVLWDDLDEDTTMSSDDLPPLPEVDDKKCPLLSALRAALEDNNVRRASLLIHPDNITLLGPERATKLFPWFCKLAFSPSAPASLSSQTFAVICQYPDFFVSSGTTVPFEVVSDALFRLGAKHSVLENAGLPTHRGIPSSTSSAETREAILLRLANFISIYARSYAFAADTIPDLVLILVLIGLESSATPDLVREVKSTIEHVCQSVDSKSTEERIATRILSIVEDLEPINKAAVVSLFIRASPRSARVLRWIARNILLGSSHPSMGTFTNIPSLKPYITLLSPIVGTQGIFDIPGNADKAEYYEELLCYVEILGAALTNIEGYVQEEMIANRGARRTSILDSPSKAHEKSDLEMITRQLDLLHGKIVDTRAAHLDRSRAKAALQQLSFRVHYQRQACLQYARGSGGGRPRLRNLESYFATPN